jgi:hypothetical protein
MAIRHVYYSNIELHNSNEKSSISQMSVSMRT